MTETAQTPQTDSSRAAQRFGISLEDYLLPTHGRIQLVDQDGALLPTEDQGTTPGHEYPMPSDEELLEGYRHLVIGRRVNDQNYALVRQGRMAVYPSFPRAGGLRGRSGPVPGAARLALPHLPGHRGRARPGSRTAGCDGLVPGDLAPGVRPA